MSVLKLNDVTFDQEVKRSTLPVLVDFWAAWCGHCRSQMPIVEELAKKLDGKLKVATVNVDEAPKKAEEYNITGIPALLIFKDGKLIEQLSGFHEKPHLFSILQKHL